MPGASASWESNDPKERIAQSFLETVAGATGGGYQREQERDRFGNKPTRAARLIGRNWPLQALGAGGSEDPSARRYYESKAALGTINAKDTQTGKTEADFQRWYHSIARVAGLPKDPDDPSLSYDFRAAFRAGAKPTIDRDQRLHWPSEFMIDRPSMPPPAEAARQLKESPDPDTSIPQPAPTGAWGGAHGKQWNPAPWWHQIKPMAPDAPTAVDPRLVEEPNQLPPPREWFSGRDRRERRWPTPTQLSGPRDPEANQE